MDFNLRARMGKRWEKARSFRTMAYLHSYWVTVKHDWLSAREPKQYHYPRKFVDMVAEVFGENSYHHKLALEGESLLGLALFESKQMRSVDWFEETLADGMYGSDTIKSHVASAKEAKKLYELWLRITVFQGRKVHFESRIHGLPNE